MNGIQGISSFRPGMEMRAPRNTTALTDDQKEQIQTILSQYDPEALTTETAQEIFAKFSAAGIEPARGMKEAITAAGFDADSILKLPHSDESENYFWPSQNASQSLNTSMLFSLQSILNQYDLTKLSEDQEQSLYSQLQDNGMFSYEGRLDLTA